MTENRAWTFCQICRAECGMIAHLQDGSAVRVEGAPKDNWSRGKMRVKGQNALEIYHRLKHRLTKLLTNKRHKPLGHGFQHVEKAQNVTRLAQ